MKIRLAYGKEGLWVELPNHNLTVLEPRYVPGLQDEREAIRAALRGPIGSPPLGELVKSGDTVAIVFSDLTRPQPREPMLSVLLEEIPQVRQESIVLINALGTHRPNTEAELVAMLGQDIARNYRIVQHDAWETDSMVPVGQTSYGRQAYVNGDYVRADFRILTGFIEPHLFAGFSGGPKAVLPGVADQGAILLNHGWGMIGHARASWGVTEGNPIWEEMREVALMTSPHFILNVALNAAQEITGVFAGDLLAAHRQGVEFVRSTSAVPVGALFDIVITSNSGYPLDLNLYQSVKGMSAAARIVKPGGSIVLAAECWDGLPEHGEYAGLLRMASSPEQLLDIIGSAHSPRQDQWDAQIQAQILRKAKVYLKSSYLTKEQVEAALLIPCVSIEETVDALLNEYGRDAAICVLPQGPMTIPYLEQGR